MLHSSRSTPKPTIYIRAMLIRQEREIAIHNRVASVVAQILIRFPAKLAINHKPTEPPTATTARMVHVLVADQINHRQPEQHQKHQADARTHSKTVWMRLIRMPNTRWTPRRDKANSSQRTIVRELGRSMVDDAVVGDKWH